MEREEILQLIKDTIRTELDQLSADDRFVFRRNLEIENGNNIEVGRRYGSKICTDIEQKLAFWDSTPVNRPVKADDPTGGATVDTQARNAVIFLIDRLEELGLIAPNA